MKTLMTIIVALVTSLGSAFAVPALSEIRDLRAARTAPRTSIEAISRFNDTINQIIRDSQRPRPLTSGDVYTRKHYGFRDAKDRSEAWKIVDTIAEAYILNQNYEFNFMGGLATVNIHGSSPDTIRKNREHIQLADFINRFLKQAFYGEFRNKLHDYARLPDTNDTGFREVLTAMSKGSVQSINYDAPATRRLLTPGFFRHLEDLLFHYKPEERAKYYGRRLKKLNYERLSLPTAESRKPTSDEIHSIINQTISHERDTAELKTLFSSTQANEQSLARAVAECILASEILESEEVKRSSLPASYQPLFDQLKAVAESKKVTDSEVLARLYADAPSKRLVEHIITAANSLKEDTYIMATMCPRRDLPCFFRVHEYIKQAKVDGGAGGLALNKAALMRLYSAWIDGHEGDGVVAVVDGFTKEDIERNRVSLFGKSGFQDGFAKHFYAMGYEAHRVSFYHGAHIASTISGNVTPDNVDFALASGSLLRLFPVEVFTQQKNAYNKIRTVEDIDVVNISLEIFNDDIAPLVRMLKESGVIIVTSAGNTTTPIAASPGHGDEKYLRAIYNELRSHPGLKDQVCVVSVVENIFPEYGAQDKLYRLASYSSHAGNRPSDPDFSRFVQDVQITSPGKGTQAKDSRTGTIREMGGTSAAAPHVSAAISILVGQFNDLFREKILGGSLAKLAAIQHTLVYKKYRASVVMGALRNGADKRDPLSDSVLERARFGSGFVNMDSSTKLIRKYFSEIKNHAGLKGLIRRG